MIESRKYKEAKRGVEVKRGVDNVKKKKNKRASTVPDPHNNETSSMPQCHRYTIARDLRATATEQQCDDRFLCFQTRLNQNPGIVANILIGLLVSSSEVE